MKKKKHIVYSCAHPTLDDDVNARIAKASAAFCRLCVSIWDQSGIRLDTKVKVFRSIVVPTLLHACKTGTVCQQHAKRKNGFRTSCLRKLLKITRQHSTHRSPEKGRDAECTYFSSEIGTVKMDRPCYQNAWWMFAKENPLWRISQKTLPWWSEETIQGQPQSLLQRLQHTNRVKGTACTGWNKVGRPHKKVAGEYEAKRICEAKQKHAHWKARAQAPQQSFLPQTSLVLSATGSLELRFISSAILEHPNNNTSHIWLGLVIVSNDRQMKWRSLWPVFHSPVILCWRQFDVWLS